MFLHKTVYKPLIANVLEFLIKQKQNIRICGNRYICLEANILYPDFNPCGGGGGGEERLALATIQAISEMGIDFVLQRTQSRIYQSQKMHMAKALLRLWRK